MLLYIAVLLSAIGGSFGTLSSLFCTEPRLTWEGGSIAFPSSSVKSLCSYSGQYLPQNIIATKAAVLFDHVFIMTPRFKRGVPCTLATYDLKSKMREPQFSPFPSLEDHQEGNCDAIQNAVDFYIDHLGFMWVLDSGTVEDMARERTVCSPKVVCISLASKRILSRLDLSELAQNGSKLQHIVADYDNSKRPYLYITDAPSRALLIYDVDKNVGYRVVLPKCVSSSQVKRDTLYIATTKMISTSSVLYLSYLNSPYIFSIQTNYLKSGVAQGKMNNVGRKIAPMVFLGTDSACSIYFRYRNESSVYVWDTSSPFRPENQRPVYTSEDDFIPTAVTYDQLRKTMKVMESNFQDFITNSCGVGAVQQLVNIDTS